MHDAWFFSLTLSILTCRCNIPFNLFQHPYFNIPFNLRFSVHDWQTTHKQLLSIWLIDWVCEFVLLTWIRFNMHFNIHFNMHFKIHFNIHLVLKQIRHAQTNHQLFCFLQTDNWTSSQSHALQYAHLIAANQFATSSFYPHDDARFLFLSQFQHVFQHPFQHSFQLIHFNLYSCWLTENN